MILCAINKLSMCNVCLCLSVYIVFIKWICMFLFMFNWLNWSMARDSLFKRHQCTWYLNISPKKTKINKKKTRIIFFYKKSKLADNIVYFIINVNFWSIIFMDTQTKFSDLFSDGWGGGEDDGSWMPAQNPFLFLFFSVLFIL